MKQMLEVLERISVLLRKLVYEVMLAKLQQTILPVNYMLLYITSYSRDSEYLNLSHNASKFHIIAMFVIVAM
jgi:hypothetical protein